jgi:hypothetical protein
MPTRRKPILTSPAEKAVRALLQKYHCPVPYHAVRTRFLGAIVSPVDTVSPIATLKGLWGGELPAFDNLAAVNELTQVMGLWNELTRHQKASKPFRFIELSVPKNIEGWQRSRWFGARRSTDLSMGFLDLKNALTCPRAATVPWESSGKSVEALPDQRVAEKLLGFSANDMLEAEDVGESEMISLAAAK